MIVKTRLYWFHNRWIQILPNPTKRDLPENTVLPDKISSQPFKKCKTLIRPTKLRKIL